jgi:hypothetical protein
VILLLASACSAGDSPVHSYDPCSALAIVPAPDTAPAELSSIEAAVLAWNQVLPTRIAVGAPSEDEPTLALRFESGDTFFRAVFWDERAEIWVSRDRLAAADYALAIAHELGHAFGLPHVSPDERASVMNVGNLEIAPTEDDAATVSERWDSCASGVRAAGSPTASDTSR